MSSHTKKNPEKITVPKIRKIHENGGKLTMLTAYDYTMAKLVDESGVDMILVGDSLGMVVQGHPNTLPVDIEEMIYHTKAVARAAAHSHVMADMPFLSYHVSHEEAVRNAGDLLKAGAESVKLEGGEELADLIWYLNKIGIPIMGHIGLKPQQVNTMGGYRIQGKTKTDADAIVNDALVLEEAGAFGLLLEGIPSEVAQRITQTVRIPTIGIGSGPHCTGQVLVIYDVLGANPEFKPRFVKAYADLHAVTQKAFGQYIDDVRNSRFPAEEHTFHRELKIVEGGETKVEKKSTEVVKRSRSKVKKKRGK